MSSCSRTRNKLSAHSQSQFKVSVGKWLPPHYAVHVVATKQQCIITTGVWRVFFLLKSRWGLGGERHCYQMTLGITTSHIFFPHSYTLSLIFCPSSSLALFFSLPLWCLPFHWLCLMQECVFLCLTLARGNNTSQWMVVCSWAFSDIQSLFF